jgi:hypothetical protein
MDTTAADWLDLLIEKAESLRKAGVRRIQFEGCEVKLAPPEPPATIVVESRAVDEPEALNDAFTYGLPPGSALPGFRRPPRSSDE